MPAVSVIVPAFNAAATLGETLAAIAAQDLAEDFEVIVVDNGSTDGTGAVAQEAPLPVKLLRRQPGRVGAARNHGAAEASSAVLAFTDADCRPDPGWLRAGLAAIASADLIQGAVRPDPRADPLPYDRTLWVGSEYGLYETANLFVRRDLFFDVGGFNDLVEADVAIPFGEDTWFGWRARRSGARTGFCADALVHHAVFRRGWDAYVAERRRLVHFPGLASGIPELRAEFFHGRWFLSSRTVRFDLAALAIAAAAATRSPLPLLAALPYASLIRTRVRRWGRRAPEVAAAEVAADVVGLAALVVGSVRWRTPLL